MCEIPKMPLEQFFHMHCKNFLVLIHSQITLFNSLGHAWFQKRYRGKKLINSIKLKEHLPCWLTIFILGRSWVLSIFDHSLKDIKVPLIRDILYNNNRKNSMNQFFMKPLGLDFYDYTTSTKTTFSIWIPYLNQWNHKPN